MSYNLYVACIHWFVVSLSVSLLAANFISSVSTMFSLHLHVFPLWAVRLLANFSEFVLLDLIQKSFYIALVGKFFIVLCQILINRPCNGGFTSLTFCKLIASQRPFTLFRFSTIQKLARFSSSYVHILSMLFANAVPVPPSLLLGCVFIGALLLRYFVC